MNSTNLWEKTHEQKSGQTVSLNSSCVFDEFFVFQNFDVPSFCFIFCLNIKKTINFKTFRSHRGSRALGDLTPRIQPRCRHLG